MQKKRFWGMGRMETILPAFPFVFSLNPLDKFDWHDTKDRHPLDLDAFSRTILWFYHSHPLTFMLVYTIKMTKFNVYFMFF